MPVVASDWNGYRETVPHGEAGFLIPTTWGQVDPALNALSSCTMSLFSDNFRLGQSVAVDIPDLMASIETLTRSRDTRLRMGEVGRAHVLANFPWPLVIRQHEDLWEQLIRVGRTLRLRDTGSYSFLAADYLAEFGHYPSRLLDADTLIKVSSFGVDVVAGVAPIRIYEEHKGHFDLEQLAAALVWLRDREPGVLSRVGDLSASILAASDVSEPTATDMVLWLLKYHLIERIPAADNEDVAS